jgi:hypothetical protein
VVADLQKEFSSLREFQNIGVLAAIAGDPDVIFVIDKDAVFSVGPLVTGSGSAPSLDKTSGYVEFQDRRRWNAAVGLRWIERSILVVVVETTRTVGDPDVIVRVNEVSADPAEDPILGSGFGQLGSNSNFGTLPDAAAVLWKRPGTTNTVASAAAATPTRVFGIMRVLRPFCRLYMALEMSTTRPGT